jgi:DNA-binding LacI/PurR family transcriptional regulator
MKDVAQRSGVSEATVSHVLNETRFVADATRKRVLQAMDDLAYFGNAHARRLARGQGDSVALIVSDIENPFFPPLIKAFEEAALIHRHDVLLCTTNYDAARAQAALRKVVAHRVAGVAIMTSSVSPAAAQVLRGAEIATVFLDTGKAGPGQSSLRIDYEKGTGEALTYLHNIGHRSFALVAGPQERPSHAAYRKGVEAAAHRIGAKVTVHESGSDLVGGERAVQQLLTLRPFPTAILCGSDLAAIGAIRALRRAGLRVPEDVSVVGADDIPFAALTEPALTTVCIPRQETGALAFELLRQMLSQRGGKGTSASVRTALVVRQSTGAAPRREKSR